MGQFLLRRTFTVVRRAHSESSQWVVEGPIGHCDLIPENWSGRGVGFVDFGLAPVLVPVALPKLLVARRCTPHLQSTPTSNNS